MNHWSQVYEICYCGRLRMYLQIMCQILFISQQTQMQQWYKTLRLYLTNLK